MNSNQYKEMIMRGIVDIKKIFSKKITEPTTVLTEGTRIKFLKRIYDPVNKNRTGIKDEIREVGKNITQLTATKLVKEKIAEVLCPNMPICCAEPKLQQEDIEKPKMKYIAMVFNKTNVGPDDIIVLETDIVISEDGWSRLSDQFKKLWPDNKVIILEQGLKLKTAKNVFELETDVF